MGTTSTALRTGSGQFCWVMAIEGFEHLVTSYSNTSAVVTAWAGTGWESCLPGLKVSGPFGQRIRPWQDSIEVQTLTVAVVPDEDDIFGKAVFKSKPTFSTRLTETFRPAADGTGTINVKSTAGAGSSGDVYVGNQRHGFSSTTGTTFTIGTAGLYNPFSADGSNVLAGPATHPQNLNFDVAAPPKVSNVPGTWIGKKVGLYIHRVVNGEVDTRAQAQLDFAGRIKNFQDSSEGYTVLELEDMRACIRDAVVLQNQWTGYVSPGVLLKAGMYFRARSIEGNSAPVDSGHLTVVASGASGPDEINEGMYEASDLASRMNAWLAADATVDGDWSFSISQLGTEGYRFTIRATFASGDPRLIVLGTSISGARVLNFLGYTSSVKTSTQFSTAHIQGEAVEANNLASEMVSDGPPLKVKFAHRNIGQNVPVDLEVHFESTEGTLYDQQAHLPYGLKGRTAAGETWAIVKVGNVVYLARFEDGVITQVQKWAGPLRYVDDPNDPDEDGVAYGSDDDRLAVRQVLLLTGTFADVFTQLVASIPGGASGVNHPDYDILPWGAGMPWSLLGDNWLTSARGLEEALNGKSIMALVTEPTRLLDLLVPELALRFAWIVWKDEGYRFVTLPTPSALTADHALTEANKASPDDAISTGRTVTMVSAEHLRNVIKLQFARRATGKYARTLEVIDSDSVASFGGSKSITIEAINSYGEEAGVGASVEEMANALVSRVMPVFSKPLKTFRRSISPDLFHATPGDTVSVADRFARDPTTGERGMDNRAGVVISVTYDRGQDGGGLAGEMEIIFADEDRHFPMAPAAEIDTSYSGTVDGKTFTNGYADTAAGGPAIKLKANAYSRSSDPDDVTHWAAGYKGRLIRLDGAVSGDAWNITVASVDAADSYLVIGADLSSPSYTAAATEKYRLQFREYSACVAAQQLYAFQADDADGMIEDAAQPNTYGVPQWQSFTPATMSTAPNLPILGEFAGDGEPFHPGLLHDISLFNNNLPNYRTAINTPVMFTDTVTSGATDEWTPAMVFPLFLGPAAAAGYVRKLYVAPMFKSTDAGNTATVRVTSSIQPPTGDFVNETLLFPPDSRSVSFTSTSTTLAEATAQALMPARGESTITWITVELKADTSSEDCVFQGLSRCYLGPAEAF